MRVFAYAMKDELQGKFKQPFFVGVQEEARRWFDFTINNDKFMKSNASDFSVYHVGFYDDETGELEHINPVKEIGGLSVVRKEE